MWEVTFSNMNGGSFKFFWTAGGALKYIKKHRNEGLYIDLENEKLEIDIRMKAPKESQYSVGWKQTADEREEEFLSFHRKGGEE